MKKNSSLYNDEINLIDLFIIIWDGKIKILLITIISFLVGFGYNSLTLKNYLNSLTLSANDSNKLSKIQYLGELLKLDQSNKLDIINDSGLFNQLILDKFISEFKDYKEFLFIIKNSRKIQKDISKLKIKDQDIELFKYTKLLEIVEINQNIKNRKNYIINFTWHDPDEAKQILQDALNFTSNNLKKKINDEFVQSIEFQKKFKLNQNNERLEYLKEQSLIAKEFNIMDSKLDYLLNLSQSSMLLDIYNQNFATFELGYYLRGYKLIQKEIEIIQNRDFNRLKLIEKELDDLKKAEINFVDYNISFMTVKSLQNTTLILVISILLGLIVGIFYVLISNVIQSSTASKK